MMSANYILSEDIARKVLIIVDAGLVSGIGVPEPGKMCVEAAVCFALDLPHGDRPPCVGIAVRRAKIRLNDAAWSSNEARTKGLRRVAVAQLGSNKLDQVEFSKRLAKEVIRQILPIALRAAGKRNPKHAVSLEAAAFLCETEPTRASALKARAAAARAADAAAYAATAAAYAASAASDARASDAASYAADAAYAASYAAYAAADAAAAAADADAARDSVLSLAAEIVVGILQEMGSEGCQWLSLTEAA